MGDAIMQKPFLSSAHMKRPDAFISIKELRIIYKKTPNVEYSSANV